VTITDLRFVFFPESFQTLQRLYQKILARCSAHRAAHLMTYSVSTAKDLAQVYGIPAEKISVAFPGLRVAHTIGCTLEIKDISCGVPANRRDIKFFVLPKRPNAPDHHRSMKTGLAAHLTNVGMHIAGASRAAAGF